MATYIDGVLVPEGLTDTEFKYWYQAQNAKREQKEAVEFWKTAMFVTNTFCVIASVVATRLLFC